jgi:hypothetical protein
MCKAANETEPALPRAYQASILFMLAMPAMVLSGFGIGFYRLSRRIPQPSDEEWFAFDAAAMGSDNADLDDAGSAGGAAQG